MAEGFDKVEQQSKGIKQLLKQ
jgi:hypothetical protein